MLYNESLTYIVFTLCYNEMIRAEHNTCTKTPAILAVTGF